MDDLERKRLHVMTCTMTRREPLQPNRWCVCAADRPRQADLIGVAVVCIATGALASCVGSLCCSAPDVVSC